MGAVLVEQKKVADADETWLSDKDVRVVAWDSMAGGIDTSATSVEWLIYLLISRPDIQQKVQVRNCVIYKSIVW